MRKHLILGAVGLAVTVLGTLPFRHGAAWNVQAQTSKSTKRGGANIKVLDARAQKAQEAFIRESVDLARSYEDAGQLTKAKSLLEDVAKLNGKLPGLKDKIRELNEAILSSNEVDLTLDTSRQGWGEPRALVFKGRTFRIQAQGAYEFVANLTVDPEGFPHKDVLREMADGVPCGALMGLIVANGKPGKPFLVGSSTEQTPNEDGVLFLRVNAPPGHRSTGELQVRISGFARVPSSK